MKLKEHIENFEKSLLKEVTATGATATFVGAPGDFIDQKFAGPFHPKSGELKKMLKKQVDDDIVKRMWVDDITPIVDPDFYEVDWEYEYDENGEIDNSKFINTSGNDQLVDLEINYDKIIDNTEENKKFINPTTAWKSIYDNKKY